MKKEPLTTMNLEDTNKNKGGRIMRTAPLKRKIEVCISLMIVPLLLCITASFAEAQLQSLWSYRHLIPPSLVIKGAPCSLYTGNLSEGLSYLGDAVDNRTVKWSTGGSAPWTCTRSFSVNGGDSAQSGSIGNNQSTWLKTTVTGPAIVRFSWKVSSQLNYDHLRLFIDGVWSGKKISGETNIWREETVFIPAGTHELRWTYSKDAHHFSGLDRGWVDHVRVVKAVVITGNLINSYEQQLSNGYVTLSSADGGKLPECTSRKSPYECPVPYGWSGTVTPHDPIRYSRFEPGEKIYTNITNDQHQDFTRKYPY